MERIKNRWTNWREDRAQMSDFERSMSNWMIVAIISAAWGFLAASLFHLLLGVIIVLVTGVVQVAVRELKRHEQERYESLFNKIQETSNARYYL